MDVLESLRNHVQSILSNDPAHDFQHIMRVYKNAQKICKNEDVNKKLVLSSVLLHDIVSYPKSDKRSKLSSFASAKKSKQILQKYNFTAKEIKIICDAIECHSFSQNMVPQTMVGKILQDADRLDALGAIGIARVFSTGCSLGRPLYNDMDPFCKNRTPDDTVWTVDHFYKKLLKLESLMNTKSAKVEAKKRITILKHFLKQLEQEI